MRSLVSTDWLAERLDDPKIVVAHVAWVHRSSAAAHAEYLDGHIPGAIFVDVDSHLSEIGDELRGRHPLPAPDKLVERLAALGIGKGVGVVATERDSFKVAARLWWLLRWIGVDDVTVLDGGLAKWRAEGRPVATVETKRVPVSPFDIRTRTELMIDAQEVNARLAAGEAVIDARAAERYAGTIEGLDKRAGHIDGARNIPLATLLSGDPPQLLSVEELRRTFQRAGIVLGKPVTAYCGSGVTACQLLWALERAGYDNIQLYPGSWSEWIELHPEAGITLTQNG